MLIQDVIGDMREKILDLQLEVASLRSNQTMLERFTWNLLVDVRKAVDEGVTIEWHVEDETEPSIVDSTVDSPERTDSGDPTLF